MALGDPPGQQIPRLHTCTSEGDAALHYALDFAAAVGHLHVADFSKAHAYLVSIPADDVTGIYKHVWRNSNTSGPAAGMQGLYGVKGHMCSFTLVLTTALSCVCKGVSFKAYMTDTHFLIATDTEQMASGPGEKLDEWYQVDPVLVTFEMVLAYIPTALDVHPSQWITKIDSPSVSLDAWTRVRIADVFSASREQRITCIADAVEETRHSFTVILPLIWLATIPHLRNIAEEYTVRKLGKAVAFLHTDQGANLHIDGKTTEALIATFNHSITIMALIRQLKPPGTYADLIPAPTPAGRVTRSTVQAIRKTEVEFYHTYEDSTEIYMPPRLEIYAHGQVFRDLINYLRDGEGYFQRNPTCGSIDQRTKTAYHPPPVCANYTAQDQIAQYFTLLTTYLETCDNLTITDIYVGIVGGNYNHTTKDKRDKKITILALHDDIAWYAKIYNHVTSEHTVVGLEDRNCARYQDQLRQIELVATTLDLADMSKWKHYPKLDDRDTRYLNIFLPTAQCGDPLTYLADEHENRHHAQSISGARIAVWTTWFARRWKIKHEEANHQHNYKQFTDKVHELATYWWALRSKPMHPTTYWKLPWLEEQSS